MYAKLSVLVVVICFVCVQLVNALQCYECTSPSGCRSPSKVSCDVAAANRTRVQLNRYFVGVSNTTASNLECLHMNYTQNNSPVMETRGCIFHDVNACSLLINATVGGTWQRQNCTVCSGNLCNGRSPAAAISGTGIFTVLASVLTVLVAKAFATH